MCYLRFVLLSVRCLPRGILLEALGTFLSIIQIAEAMIFYLIKHGIIFNGLDLICLIFLIHSLRVASSKIRIFHS